MRVRPPVSTCLEFPRETSTREHEDFFLRGAWVKLSNQSTKVTDPWPQLRGFTYWHVIADTREACLLDCFVSMDGWPRYSHLIPIGPHITLRVPADFEPAVLA